MLLHSWALNFTERVAVLLVQTEKHTWPFGTLLITDQGYIKSLYQMPPESQINILKMLLWIANMSHKWGGHCFACWHSSLCLDMMFAETFDWTIFKTNFPEFGSLEKTFWQTTKLREADDNFPPLWITAICLFLFSISSTGCMLMMRIGWIDVD